MLVELRHWIILLNDSQCLESRSAPPRQPLYTVLVVLCFPLLRHRMVIPHSLAELIPLPSFFAWVTTEAAFCLASWYPWLVSGVTQRPKRPDRILSGWWHPSLLVSMGSRLVTKLGTWRPLLWPAPLDRKVIDFCCSYLIFGNYNNHGPHSGLFLPSLFCLSLWHAHTHLWQGGALKRPYAQERNHNSHADGWVKLKINK